MGKFFGGMIYTNQVHCPECNITVVCKTEKQSKLWWKLHNKNCKNPKKYQNKSFKNYHELIRRTIS